MTHYNATQNSIALNNKKNINAFNSFSTLNNATSNSNIKFEDPIEFDFVDLNSNCLFDKKLLDPLYMDNVHTFDTATPLFSIEDIHSHFASNNNSNNTVMHNNDYHNSSSYKVMDFNDGYEIANFKHSEPVSATSSTASNNSMESQNILSTRANTNMSNITSTSTFNTLNEKNSNFNNLHSLPSAASSQISSPIDVNGLFSTEPSLVNSNSSLYPNMIINYYKKNYGSLATTDNNKETTNSMKNNTNNNSNKDNQNYSQNKPPLMSHFAFTNDYSMENDLFNSMSSDSVVEEDIPNYTSNYYNSNVPYNDNKPNNNTGINFLNGDDLSNHNEAISTFGNERDTKFTNSNENTITVLDDFQNTGVEYPKYRSTVTSTTTLLTPIDLEKSSYMNKSKDDSHITTTECATPINNAVIDKFNEIAENIPTYSNENWDTNYVNEQPTSNSDKTSNKNTCSKTNKNKNDKKESVKCSRILKDKDGNDRRVSDSRLSAKGLAQVLNLSSTKEALQIEKNILNIFQNELHYPLGYRTWIRDNTKTERKYLIEELYQRVNKIYPAYDIKILETVIRRATYSMMQSRLRKERKCKQENANKK